MVVSSFAPRQGLTLYTADNHTVVLDREIGRGGEGKEDRGDVPPQVGQSGRISAWPMTYSDRASRRHRKAF
jgi:hypothetical protein